MDLFDARRELEERLAELKPASPEAEAAKPAFKREVQFLYLQLGALDLFERVSRGDARSDPSRSASPREEFLAHTEEPGSRPS